MLFSSSMPAKAASGDTEQFALKLAQAGMQKAAGKIPIVGAAVSAVIGEFMPEVLGIKEEPDAVALKLNEIYDAVAGLNLKMGKNQQ